MTGSPTYRMRLPANVRVRGLWAMVALLLVGLVSLIRFAVILTIIINRTDEALFVYWAIVDWYSIVTVVTLIIFIVWLYGAHANLGSFGRASRFKPSATVYWWFVPLANLFMPYRVTSDVQAEMVAVGTDDYQDRDPVKWWWATLVAGVVLYLVSVQFDTPAGQFAWPLTLEAVSSGLLVVAAYFGIRLVNRITGLQIE